MEQTLIVALAGAAAVFVVWVAVAQSLRRWWERRQLAQSLQSEVPAPTPDEIREAQALGIVPPGSPAGPHSAN